MTAKTVFITGASVGIGRETAIILANAGYNLVLLARRSEKLNELENQLKTKVHIITCDINQHDELQRKLATIPEPFKKIDVLVNNAGLALGMNVADKTEWQDWQTMIQTNCLSLAFLTRQILPSMIEYNSGHIINLGSTAGSYAYQGGNVYGATKAFVEQFSNNLRTDLLGKKVRVSHISPGMTGETEFSNVRFHGDDEKANKVYDGYEALKPEDVAESIRWVITQPSHVNINRIELMPTCQAPAGLVVSKL